MSSTSASTSTAADGSLAGRRVLLVGGGGINRDLARHLVADAAEVVIAGRDVAELTSFTDRLGPRASARYVDLGHEGSIQALAEATGSVDHLVSAAAAPANGAVDTLRRDDVMSAFDAKVIGPLLLVKHFRDRFRQGGSLLVFSGVLAWRPAPGRVVMATANGAVDFLVRALAVELAPVRVNAISPGITDSGSWDSLGEARDSFFERTALSNPARRIGSTGDIVQAMLLALTNPFLTGETLHVDGGGRLA
jgi:NAD(P)-dependent dehydrogenase (short-subunit alcohol dehydrogenase family)